MADPAKQAIYMAPWRERRPDGELGKQYGPSPSTYARQLNNHRNWAWAPTKQRDDLADCASVIESGRASSRERDCYELLKAGHSEREAASHLGVTRDSVRTYIRRLKAKAKDGSIRG